jgi:hypothetical protein
VCKVAGCCCFGKEGGREEEEKEVEVEVEEEGERKGFSL